MFIRSKSWCTSGGQHASGPFLMLFMLNKYEEPSGYPEEEYQQIRAAVRHVRLKQCGHRMMGSAKIGPHEISVSGCYGADGLFCDPSKYPGLWEQLVLVPPELTAQILNSNDGWNSCGSEGAAACEWAKLNEKTLRIRWKGNALKGEKICEAGK